MRFAIFLLHLSKVLRLPRKIDAKSYEVLHLSRKIILANLQIWCSKMQPLSGNERPDLLTSLMNMSFVLRLPRKMHLCRSSSKVPRLPSFLEMLQNPHVFLCFSHFWQDRQSLAPATRNDIWASKSGANMWCFVFNILTSTCASRIFAPQGRALFWHLNFQKWSERWCVLYILTSTCASRHKGVHFFPHLNFQKWSYAECVLYILTSTCASRHNGVHFFDISTSKSGPTLRCFVHFDFEMCFVATTACTFSSLIWPARLRTRRFSEPTFFNPPEPQIIGKRQCFAAFLPFRASASSFFWLFLFYSSLF